MSVAFLPRLPDEAGLHILSFLDPYDLTKSCQVSKTWNRLAGDNALWKRLFSEIEFPAEIKPKEYVARHAVKTQREVLRRLNALARDIQFDQRGEWRCSFPFNPGCSIHAEILFGGVTSESKKCVREFLIFMRKLPDNGKGILSLDSRSLRPRIRSKVRAKVPGDDKGENKDFVAEIAGDIASREHVFPEVLRRRRCINIRWGIRVGLTVVAVGVAFFASQRSEHPPPLYARLVGCAAVAVIAYRIFAQV